MTGFPPISMEMPKNEICHIRGINFCFTGTFWPTLYGHSYINRGTQRRFPPKCIKNTFWAIQSTIRSLEMLSKRRFEIYICSVILGHFESFRNFQGFSIIFPAKLLIASHPPPHKHLLNRRQHSFPMLSQSHCTFQILESWPWPQGNLIITRSALNTGKAFWPLINVRFRAAKIRFSQILEYSMHCITLAKNRKEGKR